jgi:hypothetical protein
LLQLLASLGQGAFFVLENVIQVKKMDNGRVGKHLNLPTVGLLGGDVGAVPEVPLHQRLPKSYRAGGKGTAEIGGIATGVVAMEVPVGQPIR